MDEEGSSSNVTVSLELNAGSGFSNPSVAYTVSLSSTAMASGDYQDHNLSNGTVTFDGDVGDQAQSITFTLMADTYDEGVNSDNSVFESIIITLDGDNVSNTRVDDTESNGFVTHTVKIRDNDPTPQLEFSSDASVSAVTGAESVASPTIKVIVADGSGNSTPSALPITLSVTNHTSTPGTATIWSNATAPWDYKIDGENGSVTDVTIPAYSPSYSIPITINSDAYYEGDTDETVKFDVTVGNNASGGTFTHTYTIEEDDAKPTIYFTSGGGVDTFVIRVGSGGLAITDADTFTDFTDGTDLIGLDNGLTFADLTIEQGTGSYSSHTIVKAGSEYLAIVQNMTASDLTESSFTPVNINESGTENASLFVGSALSLDNSSLSFSIINNGNLTSNKGKGFDIEGLSFHELPIIEIEQGIELKHETELSESLLNIKLPKKADSIEGYSSHMDMVYEYEETLFVDSEILV